MKINGETQIVGFFGSTYKTSKMYAVYNAAFKALNLNYVYIPFVVFDLKRAVDGIRHMGIKGAGVTIPYKIEILKYLDDLDENAKKIGAVNAVINNNGKLIGGNTDGLGAVKALEEVTKLTNNKIILCGSGGAARAIAFAVKDEGGNLAVTNRTNVSGRDLANAVNCPFIQFDQLDKEIKDADILINATSVGMAPRDRESIIDKKLLNPGLIVMDIVTNPKETKLLRDAKEKKCKIVYGERMLFWQAVLKFKLFTGVEAPIKVMENALC